MSAAPFGYGKVRASFTDVGLLIGRLVIGAVVFMHGWQKFTEMGYAGVVEMFSGIGAPVPQLTAALVIFLEVVGSVALAVGIFTRVVAVLIALNMVGALLLLHLPNGFFVADGGYELVALIGGTALIYAFAGPGRLSIDAIFLRVMSKRGDRAEKKAEAEATDMLNGIASSPGSAPRSSEPATKPAAKTGAATTTSVAAKRETAARSESTTSAGATKADRPAGASPKPEHAAKPETTKPETTKPETTKPGATTTSAAKPDAAKPDAASGAGDAGGVDKGTKADNDQAAGKPNGSNRITV